MDKKISPIYYTGVYGNMRELFLRTHKPMLYKRLAKTGALEDHLKTFQAHYSAIAEDMHQRLAEERGVNQQLLQFNYCEWIARTLEIQNEVRDYMIHLINENNT